MEKLGYIIIEKRKGLAGNYNVYKKLKHLISTKVVANNKSNKVKVDGNSGNIETSLDGQVAVEYDLDLDVVREIESLDINSNVRLARSVVNIDNSGLLRK